MTSDRFSASDIANPHNLHTSNLPNYQVLDTARRHCGKVCAPTGSSSVLSSYLGRGESSLVPWFGRSEPTLYSLLTILLLGQKQMRKLTLASAERAASKIIIALSKSILLSAYAAALGVIEHRISPEACGPN